MKKYFCLAALVFVLMFTLVSCSSGDKETTPASTRNVQASKNIMVGFIFPGPVGDEGYVDMHNNGRLALEKTYGIKTAFVENISDKNGDATDAAIRGLIDQGCNVIYATSFGYMDTVEALAKEFPRVKFGHATGYKTAENISTYFGRVYEVRYLSGIVAGMQTQTNKIGFVAALPIPEVIRSINAFTLGVKSVNPAATVEVQWVGDWYVPDKEKSVAIELIDKGCDVITQHTNSTSPLLTAEEKGVFGIGYNTKYSETFKNAYLTTPYINWTAFYLDDIKSVIDGTWKSRSYWGGIDSGMVAIDELSQNCKDLEAIQKAVNKAKEEIVSGKLKIFTGSLKDNTGVIKVNAGTTLTDEEMLAMDWLIEGVIGTVK